MSPFLMLDYAGPAEFPPTTERKGVGSHPHRGFETVTIVYKGEVAHKDSTGQGGVIGPGDVQWMTAGKGIVHAEMPTSFEEDSIGFQLWLNLDRKNKYCEPKYQEFKADSIPVH
jgi:redox-sensitive bicupin YhaK (pirin superfamily)